VQAELELRERLELDPDGQTSADVDRSRRACQADLSTFVREAWDILEPGNPFLPNWHIELICEYLSSISRGERKRLVFNMPPRYGKSLLISVFWPCWEWTFRPEERWVFASYAQNLADDHSLARRTLIESDWYQSRWGDVFELRGDQNQKREFRNDRRGTMIATSVGGTATGKGGNRLVVDDPVNPKQAESEILRHRADEWFGRTLSTRLNDKKRGVVVLVMQRLHQDDLTAKCLELGYEAVVMPGVAEKAEDVIFPSGRIVHREPGDLLWPAREGPVEIEQARLSLGEYGWASQYGQRPAPMGGGIFQVGKFQLIDEAPPDIYHADKVRYWDKASLPSGLGARTAGVLMWKTHEGNYYIVDVVKGRWSPGERERVIRDTAEDDGHEVTIWVEREPGSGGLESYQATARNLDGFDVREDNVHDSKSMRWRPFASQIEAGNVYVVRASWTASFLDELSLLPFGSLKDMADAAAGAYAKLALGAQAGRWMENSTDPYRARQDTQRRRHWAG
jgi:predicted phage terminase large subunit-like protein